MNESEYPVLIQLLILSSYITLAKLLIHPLCFLANGQPCRIRNEISIRGVVEKENNSYKHFINLRTAKDIIVKIIFLNMYYYYICSIKCESHN
jgi:hypothetical protein